MRRAFCSPVEECLGGDCLGAVRDGRDRTGAARRACDPPRGRARASSRRRARVSILDVDGGARGQILSIAPSRRAALQGNGLSGSRARRASITAARAATASARAAAMATPISAMTTSRPSSRRRASSPSESRRLRCAMARSKRPARVRWPGSKQTIRRSRKRRRSEAGPVNSPSVAGVTPHHLDVLAESAGAGLGVAVDADEAAGGARRAAPRRYARCR